jgi:hypothetical protein
VVDAQVKESEQAVKTAMESGRSRGQLEEKKPLHWRQRLLLYSVVGGS